MNAVQPNKRIQPDTSVAVAAKQLLKYQLEQVWLRLKLAAQFAQDDIENIHQLRIATRRSIATLDIFRDYLSPRLRRRTSKELKQIRRVVAHARDLDVLIQQLSAASIKDRSLLKKLKKKRRKVQLPVVATFRKLNHKNRFYRDCRKLIQSLEKRKRSQRNTFAECARTVLGSSTAGFFKRRPDDVTDLTQLHRFRIAAKTFRYRLEVIELAFPPKAFLPIIKDMKRLQELLGTLNDHAVAIARFRRMKSKGHKIKSRVISSELDGLTKSKVKFEDWWTPERAEGIRRRIDVFTSL